MGTIMISLALLGNIGALTPSFDANDFAFRMYRQLETEQPGTTRFVSPFSASTALSLLTAGADGETASELCSVLGCEGMTPEQLNALCARQAIVLEAADKGVAMETANSVWAEGFLRIKKKYLRDASKYYDAVVKTMDFNDPATADAINGWCSDKTHGKIAEIVDRLAPGTVMALLNAVYFKGRWQFGEFPETIDDTFRCIDGRETPVTMMLRTRKFGYAADDCFEMVELPYGNGAFVMDILLPRNDVNRTFSSAVMHLDCKRWNALCHSLKITRVQLEIPKFRMEQETDLCDCLQAMGIRKAFTESAGFSGISRTPLCVGTVRQKAFVEVNETGTEAAAVTYIGVKTTAFRPEPDPVVFRADRPFVFVIREKNSGTILFIGQKTE